MRHNKTFLRFAKLAAGIARNFARFDLPKNAAIPANKRVIVVSNHRSFFDVMAAFTCFSKLGYSCRTMVFTGYMRHWSPLAKALGGIPTCKERRQQAEDDAVEALEQGEIVAMMPEGRLVDKVEWRKDGVGQFRLGISRIATRGNATVVPMVMTGTESVWPKGSWLPRFSCLLEPPLIRIRFGEPFELDEEQDHTSNAAFAAHRVAQEIRRAEEEESVDLLRRV
ncbi:Inherit from COG: phosphoserine phosphatase activity [Seminavis robusta]|uniref:Inherit from COG: phosphoserine phosphatase activity n=1 Tax=Seminavis robusta TaxID=568900 RepID=A0A9N8HNX5_9STRA|nr:Inherit from COG: phosphoserine phosphatase activity [Seminavis robusta]|eukprot:Sro858_g211760.1 Inherit from COG: phosphoserine phosphatase activity (224) ;mRNA; r:1022-1693